MAYQPKNYKKFVATAATATLVASAIAPAAFADQASTSAFTDVGDRYTEAVDYVVSNNISNGLTATKFGVGESITRGDAAIMIAKATGLMNEKAPNSGFSDVPSRGAVAVNSLKAAGVLSGVSDTKFGWDQSITRGQAAFMLAQAYDLEAGDASKLKFTDVGAKHRFATQVASLVENKITEGVTPTSFGIESSIKRGDFAIFLHRLSELEKAPTTLGVTSVTALNAKELQVKFNTAIDSVDAKELSKYTLEGEEFEAVVISEDGRTVTLTSKTELKVNNAKLTVEPIKTKADGTVLTEVFTTLFSFEDTAAPQVTSVDAKGTTSVIKFNESVESFGTVSLNGAVIAENAGYTVSADRKTLTVTGLVANQSYKVDVVGAVDYAKNMANPIALNFTVAPPVVDNSKPAVSTSVTDTKITFDFSEELVLQDLNADSSQGEYAKVTVGSTTYYLTAADMDSNDNTKFTIDAISALGNNTFINTKVKVEGHKDLANNAGDAFEFSTTLKKDTTPPSLVSASAKLLVADDTKVTTDVDAVYLTFSEPVKVNGNFKLTAKNGIVYTDAAPIVINDASAAGVDVNGNGKIEGSELNTVKVNVDLDANSSYTFELAAKAVTDVHNNVISNALNVNVATSTFTAPTPESKASLTLEALNPVVVDQTNNNVFTIDYAADVTSSATVASNYTLGGKALPAGTLVQFVNGTDKVRFTLPEGSITANGSYVLEVNNVVDTAGNTLKDGKASVLVPLKESVAPTATKVNISNSKNFTVDFSEVLKDQVAPTGVTVKVNGNVVTTSALTVTNGDLAVTTTEDYALTDKVTVEFKSTNLVDANGNFVKNATISN
ncbi:S-layer homology domain-containing protein [Planococcus sp. SE5232]|uniref:S-layer homology domain-containing protein n=1 Tax=unclassified Planococcus (in: firmicutes) TaxID=2662419 RepID=UPI003D6A923C